MKLNPFRRRTGKHTEAGRITALEQEIARLHRDNGVLAGQRNGWRRRALEAETVNGHFERTRQEAVDHLNRVRDELRVLKNVTAAQPRHDRADDEPAIIHVPAGHRDTSDPRDQPTEPVPRAEQTRPVGRVIEVMPIFRAPVAVRGVDCLQPVGLSKDRKVAWGTGVTTIPPVEPDDPEATQLQPLVATLRNADLGALQRKPEPEPAHTQPASEADTQRLPAVDGERTGETAVPEGAHA